MRLANKTAIVTGGGSGFGAGIARKFAAEGARVMVADINLDAAKEIADEIGGIAQQVDVANADSVHANTSTIIVGNIRAIDSVALSTHLPSVSARVPSEIAKATAIAASAP